MRSRFALIFCFACLSGCVGVREHWADGFGWMWQRSCSQVAKHGPELAADAAVETVTDPALYNHESPRKRQERSNEEFFGD
jgi:hypothetical protein